MSPTDRLRSSPARFVFRSACTVFSQRCLVVFCQAPVALCFAENLRDPGPPNLLLPRPFARLRGPIGIVLLLEFTRIAINRLSRSQKRLGVGDALATVMGNSERFGRKGIDI